MEWIYTTFTCRFAGALAFTACLVARTLLVHAQVVHLPPSFTYSAMLSQSEHACNPVNLHKQCGRCCLVCGRYHGEHSFTSTAEAALFVGAALAEGCRWQPMLQAAVFSQQTQEAIQ